MKNILRSNQKDSSYRYGLLSLFILLIPFTGIAQDFSSLYERLNPSVVTILTTETVFSDGRVSTGQGLGSGVVIDAEGLVITAAHVVGSAESITVKTFDGQLIKADVISSVATADVALLKLETAPVGINVAAMGDSDKVKTGDQVLVIGAPFGIEHSLSVGHISGKQNRGMILSGQELEFLQTDAAINTGNSGGPMFNTDGQVIGIVSSILTKAGGFDGIGFAASINPTKDILFEGSSFWTGFEGVFMNETLARIFNVPAAGGVLVQRVVSNSAADKAGLKGGRAKIELLGRSLWIGGDIILEIQNTVCKSSHDVRSIRETIGSFEAGDKVMMKVLRGGEVIELAVQL